MKYLKYGMKRELNINLDMQYAKGNNNDVLNEMSFVLINIFGLTARQIIEIERNGGFTNDDLH